MTRKPFPSVWLADFRAQIEYEEMSRMAQSQIALDWLDDRVLHSRHPFSYPAYCACCEAVRPMQVDWRYGGAGDGASVNPAWTETAVCSQCGLNSRMRAVIDFLKTRTDLSAVRQAYVAERTTPAYRALEALLPRLVGSEYLGPDRRRGEIVAEWHGFLRLRHEDLTALSFPDREFDLAITQDVFEHVPDYRKAFAEIARVLRPAGRLVFTIPFFPDLATTRIRASLGPEGLTHHLPPEIHGNPVSSEGALCFQNFGWDILGDLREAGFADAFAAWYWGPWQGHLGLPFFVFSAVRPQA